MKSLPRISVIIPTRDRPKDLAELLMTILDQSYSPIEVIVLDDSPIDSAKKVVDSFSSGFESIGCKLKYLRGSLDGLPAARNLGVRLSEGDATLFLDDDTLLNLDVVSGLAVFLKNNNTAVGVQPEILDLKKKVRTDCLAERFGDAVYKAMMLTYHAKDKLAVRRSGHTVLPDNLTKVISAQRLSGCCCCYKRKVFKELIFDTNLKRWGFMEDLDFSYRVYKMHRGSLYVIPHAKIVHKASRKARPPTKQRIYMMTIYWFYVFFKDIFEGSILNLMTFLWALIGNLVVNAGGAMIKTKTKCEWWTLIYLLKAYAISFRNLRNILMLKLEFFNRTLNR